MTTLSLHRHWVFYKRTAIAHGTGGSKRDLALAQIAFYSGARAVLQVLDHRIADGGSAEAADVKNSMTKSPRNQCRRDGGNSHDRAGAGRVFAR
jgi:hypothetical protein